MNEKIAWSKRAERAYGQIIDYVADEFGTTRAKRYATEVYKAVSKLPDNPNLGQIEPLLEGSKYEFRRLVIGHLTKVIYRIVEERIEIADVWDTRMNPAELVARFAE
jgi:plasmid stabilization system protein ParE